VSKNIGGQIEHFFQILLTILLCINFQCAIMLVDGCNLAQLTA